MLHDFSEALEQKCSQLGEPSAVALLLRSMALSFAIGFVSFEGLYRFEEDVRSVKSTLVAVSVSSFALTAVLGILLLFYILGRRAGPRRRMHHHNW